jgi:hypothetical protein
MACTTLCHNTYHHHHHHHHLIVTNHNIGLGEGRVQCGLVITIGVNLKIRIHFQWPILSLTAASGGRICWKRHHMLPNWITIIPISWHTRTTRRNVISWNVLLKLRFKAAHSNISEWYKLQTNSVVWVRERSTPTKRPPLVGEVIANFCG